MVHNVLGIAKIISGNYVNAIIGNSNNGAWNPIMDGIPNLFYFIRVLLDNCYLELMKIRFYFIFQRYFH